MSAPRNSNELEEREIRSLLDAVYYNCGFDFRKYSLPSLRRRIWNTICSERVASISGLEEKVMQDPSCLDRFLLALSINVTSMFRDPSFFLVFRKKIAPLLRAYDFIRIWHAGCSTGEEVYSMAILMEEEELYDRSRIYATDMNKVVLRKAKEGIFPLRFMQEYTHNYLKAGGKSSFSDYYRAGYDSAIFRKSLKRNIIFSHHNLATDGLFNSFDVILCRNVLIYFNNMLQERVHKLLYESLGGSGILALGRKETVKFTPHWKDYEELDGAEKLYRKMSKSIEEHHAI